MLGKAALPIAAACAAIYGLITLWEQRRTLLTTICANSNTVISALQHLLADNTRMGQDTSLRGRIGCLQILADIDDQIERAAVAGSRRPGPTEERQELSLRRSYSSLQSTEEPVRACSEDWIEFLRAWMTGCSEPSGYTYLRLGKQLSQWGESLPTPARIRRCSSLVLYCTADVTIYIHSSAHL